MSGKIFEYGAEARSKLLKGVETLEKCVATTLGPSGRNVLIQKDYGLAHMTKDGVTVAKSVILEDPLEEMGCSYLRSVASSTADIAGDGTTSSSLIAASLYKQGVKLVAAGHNPMELRRGIEDAAKEVLKKLGGISEDIGSKKDRIAEVATISAGDSKIGELIADVMDKVGKDGVVTVEEGQALQMEAEVVEGFTMDRGYLSPYMVTDTSRMEAVYEKPLILITDMKIGSVQEFLPMLEKLAQAGKKDLVLIAEDVEGEALGTLVLNRLKGVFNTVAIKAPAFGDRRKEVLQDIAVLTGATVITEEQGHTFESADISFLGTARKVIVTKDDTTIIEGGGNSAEMKARMNQIAAQIKAASSEYQPPFSLRY